MIGFRLHISEILAGLITVDQLMAARFEAGMQEAGEFVLEKSLEIVPYETGALYNTGHTFNIGGHGWKASQVISFGGPELEATSKSGFDYALIQHENPHYYHAPPTSYKYITRPIMENKKTIRQIIKKKMGFV